MLSEREFVCKNCGLVIDRDLNAAVNLKNFGLNKLRTVSPEVTPMDKRALTYPSSIGVSETVLDEVGISQYSEMST